MEGHWPKNLYEEGADIVMPVDEPVGLGSAALALELGTDSLKIIGVDVDQYVIKYKKCISLFDNC
jgi:Uncharacterized ABC-type transport system, periplasmic component/surface lipoprotein